MGGVGVGGRVMVMVMFTKALTWRGGHKASFVLVMRLCITTKVALLLCDVTDAQYNVRGNIESN